MVRSGAGFALGTAAFGCTRTEGATRFRELRRGAGVFEHAGRQGGAIGWLATAKSAVIVDTQVPESLRKFLSEFQRHSPATLEIVINTHHHRDHTGGNAIVRPIVREIVAHANVPGYLRKMRQEVAVSPAGFPDRTFTEEWRADFDGETVRARHFGAAHTGGDVVVAFEKADVVHVGDLVYNRFHPHIDVGHGGTLLGWVKVLNEIVASYGPETIFICSHAKPGFPVVLGRPELDYQRNYLESIIEHARRGVNEGRAREETISVPRLAGFEEHVSINERHTLSRVIAAAWDEVSTVMKPGDLSS